MDQARSLVIAGNRVSKKKMEHRFRPVLCCGFEGEKEGEHACDFGLTLVGGWGSMELENLRWIKMALEEGKGVFYEAMGL